MRASPILRFLALAWLCLLVLAAAWLLHNRISLTARLDTDLLALLPNEERQPGEEAALKALSTAGEKKLALLACAPSDTAARQAAAEVRRALAPLPLHASFSLAASPAAFYAPYRAGLLTERDRRWLSDTDSAANFAEAATARALSLAFSPFTPGALPWRSDPFGLFGNWLQALGEASPLRPMEGELMLFPQDGDASFCAALLYTHATSAFATGDGISFTQALHEARTRLQQRQPDARLLAAGVALHAEAARQQAEREMRLIGAGSLIGTLLLIGFAFQSARALGLIALSLVAGSLVALFSSFWLFERLHLVTLVFGASLIGVAVDYAILVYAQHLGSEEAPERRFRRLLPTLASALIVPMLAYLALALTPFPGLKQMAGFAASGILGAWISVVLFYPFLLPARLPLPGNARLLQRLLLLWPRWRGSPGQWLVAALLLLAVVGGCLQLKVNDDIRSLFSGEARLIEEQIEVSRRLRLPSPAQMFLISAPSAEMLLQREEKLIASLSPFFQAGALQGYEGVSRWLPSQARQQEARLLQEKLRPSRVQLAQEFELPETAFSPPAAPLLTPEIWLADPASAPLRGLWLPPQHDFSPSSNQEAAVWRSMVLLQGLQAPDVALRLSRLAAAQDGVVWVDQTQNITRLMQRYRRLLTQTLILACLIAPLLLALRFRRAVWRICLPVLLAGAATLAAMGYLGIPVQMLSILALLLSLGMGVDYAIFLEAEGQNNTTLTATTLACLLTLLSFGLLALSATPALHALGLTATLGVTLSWLFTPVFRSGISDSCPLPSQTI